jgi:hypothetical protein
MSSSTLATEGHGHQSTEMGYLLKQADMVVGTLTTGARESNTVMIVKEIQAILKRNAELLHGMLIVYKHI